VRARFERLTPQFDPQAVWAGILRSLEHRIHVVGRNALELHEHVRVGVEREADLAVAQDLHDGARIDALQLQQRRAAMPQRVKPAARDLRSLQQRVKLFAQVGIVDRRAYRGCEDEALFLPRGAGYEPLFLLALRCAFRASTTTVGSVSVRRLRFDFGSPNTSPLPGTRPRYA
jgi:hypothetical protein